MANFELLRTCLFFLKYQNVEAEKFETSPILFGDFMKMGADPADRIYEELVDISKVKNLLADVSLLASLLS